MRRAAINNRGVVAECKDARIIVKLLPALRNVITLLITVLRLAPRLDHWHQVRSANLRPVPPLQSQHWPSRPLQGEAARTTAAPGPSYRRTPAARPATAENSLDSRCVVDVVSGVLRKEANKWHNVLWTGNKNSVSWLQLIDNI